jgi:riboflavin synthase
MFTGIVRETGEIAEKWQNEEGATFRIRSRELLGDLGIGHSISVDGVCLTVTEKDTDSFQVVATPETLRLTNLGEKNAEDPVNLEPAARLTDFLGGHLVQGHVDGTGVVASITPEGNSRIFRFAAPPAVLHYCTLKGSITVNGVSLTISGLDDGCFEVTIIPHTDEVTDFRHLKPGDKVNLEADVISKYVESHVKRVLGGVSLFLLMGVLTGATLFGTSLPNPGQTVLIYQNVTAGRETPMIVRVARFKPDIFMEWESTSHQGTIHLYQEAVRNGKTYIIESLFEAGVDAESPQAVTLWLSEKMFRELREKGQAKINLNNVGTKIRLTGTETYQLQVDKKGVEVPVIRLEDERKNVWIFQDDSTNPLLLEFSTTRYRRYLKSVVTSSWTGLKWIKEVPPVR